MNYSQVIIEIAFNQIGNVEKHLRDNYQLLDTTYGDYVSYIVNIKTCELLLFKAVITNYTKGESHCEILNKFDRYE